MNKSIIAQQNPEDLARLNDSMTCAGQAANEAGARHAFEDHTARQAENTIRRKIADLAPFETFLQSAGVPAIGLYDNPQAWRGFTWVIVEVFRNWQLQQGCAIGSLTGRLSTVRTYARIAARAEAITPRESMLIAAYRATPARKRSILTKSGGPMAYRHVQERRKPNP